MNRELKRVTIVALLMFLTLFVSTTIIQYVQAEASRPTRATPARSTRATPSSAARSSSAASRSRLAASDDDYKFQRVYANGPLYAAVTGYIPVNGEATGLERRSTTYLSGQLEPVLRPLNRLISGQDPMGASVEVAIDPVRSRRRGTRSATTPARSS